MVTYYVDNPINNKANLGNEGGGTQFLKTKIVQVMFAEHKLGKLEMNNHKLKNSNSMEIFFRTVLNNSRSKSKTKIMDSLEIWINANIG